MVRIFLTPRSEADLIEIFEYSFFKWGLTQAEKYQDDLYDGFKLILENGDIGKIYFKGTQEYHNIHINRHLIFYRIEQGMCIIIRILHDRMDFSKHIDTE